MQINNDEDSAEVDEDPAAEEEVVRIAFDLGPAPDRSRSTGHGGTSRTGRGANGVILAEAEVNRTERGQKPPSPLWPWIVSS